MENLIKRNNVLQQNPLVANIDISVNASDFLWAIFCIMAASALGLLFLAQRRPVGQRAFHHLAAIICFIASIAYFSMASDLGATPIVVEFIRGGTLGANWVALGVDRPTRSIWYVRYIDWVLTTPLLLLELLLSTGLPLSEIFTTVFFDEVMIITGLIGALVTSRYKWGYFAMGCAAELWITWVLVMPARKSANRLGPAFHKEYVTSAAILCTLWFFYPIAWGLCDGGNVITPTSEMIFYGVLDVLAKPVFCFFHVLTIQKLDYNLLGFSSGKVSDGATNPILGDHPHGHHNGVMEGRQSTSTAVDGGVTNGYPKTANGVKGVNPGTATAGHGGVAEPLHQV